MAIPQMKQQFILTNEAREISRKSHSIDRVVNLLAREGREIPARYGEIENGKKCRD